MKILKSIFDKIISPLLVFILSHILLSIKSKISTGNYLKIFKKIHLSIYITFYITVFFWIIIILIRSRKKKIRMRDVETFEYYEPEPEYPIGCDRFDQNYKGVIWKIQIPKKPPSDSSYQIFDSDIYIEPNPRCPICQTVLKELPGFWGGYKWICVNGDFKKRNKDKFYSAKNDVKRLIKPILEKKYN